eukprot:SAG11_NODE_2985_length_2790_cov_5.176886_3_plen_83_part_00
MAKDEHAVAATEAETPGGVRQATALDDYLFDLRGFIILENAVEPELIRQLNLTLDSFPTLAPQEWHGYVHRCLLSHTAEARH